MGLAGAAIGSDGYGISIDGIIFEAEFGYLVGSRQDTLAADRIDWAIGTIGAAIEIECIIEP